MLPDLSGTKGKSFILPHVDKKKKKAFSFTALHVVVRKKKKIYIQSAQVLTLQTTWCRIRFALCAFSPALRNEGNMSVISTSN